MNRPKINTPADGKCGYIAFFDGRSAEVWADTQLQAKERAVTYFKPAKSKKHMVHCVIAEVEGEPVVHSTSEFG